MKRTLTAIILAGVTSIGFVANAAARPYTEGEMKHDSLRVSDVPDSYFVNQPKQRALAYTAVPNTKQFEMCVDKDGHKVFGDAPAGHENSSIFLQQNGEGADATKVLAVSSDIYTYASKTATKTAWSNLKTATSRCAATAGTQVPIGDKELVDVTATQTITPLAWKGGGKGFSNEQHVAALIAPGDPEGISLWVGGYTAYRVVKKAIVRVQWANYSRTSAEDAALKSKWIRFAYDVTGSIADRVAAKQG